MTNGNDPAFPNTFVSHELAICQNDGLTKREVFAKAAMQGMLANSAFTERAYEMGIPPGIPQGAVALADEMIAELNRRPIPAMPEESSS